MKSSNLAAALILIGSALSGCAPPNSNSDPNSENADLPSQSASKDPTPKATSSAKPEIRDPEAESLNQKLQYALNQFEYSSESARWIGRSLKEHLGSRPGSFSRLTQFSSSIISTSAQLDFPTEIKKIQKEYEAVRSRQDTLEKVYAAHNEVVKSALGAASETSGLGGLLMKGVSYSTGKFLDYTMDVLHQQGMDDAENVLNRHLNRLSFDQFKEWDNLKNLPPDEAQKTALKLAQGISLDLSRVSPQDRDMARGAANGFLARAALGELARQQSLDRLRRDADERKFRQSETDLAAVSASLTSFGKETNARLSELKQTQGEILQGVNEINARVQSLDGNVQSLSKDVDFLSVYFFGRMGTSDRLKALQGGFFPGMDPGKRAEEIRKLELTEKRENYVKIASDILDGSQLLISLASKFGASPALLSKASTVVHASNAAVKIFAAFSSGEGFMGAAEAFVGIFGGPDVAEERHQQVMERLDLILQGQDRILDGQRDILLSQQKLFEGERAILQGIVAVSEQIQKSHEIIMEKLESLRGDILVNREMIRTILLKDYNQCEPFLSARENYGFDKEMRGFALYSQMSAHFSDHSSRFRDCINGLEALLNVSQSAQTYLKMESYLTQDNRVNDFITRVYNPAWGLAADASRKDSSEKVLYASLMLPSPSFEHLEGKLSLLKAQADLKANVEYPTSWLQSAISTEIVIQATQDALEVAPYFELSTRGLDRMKTLDELLSGVPQEGVSKASARGKILLLRALPLLDLAISQEAVLSGDLSLEFLYNHFEEWSAEKGSNSNPLPCSDSANFSKPICVLENNPLLAHNLATYAVRKDLQATGYKNLAYTFAFNREGEAGMLRQVLRKNWNLVWSAQASEKPSRQTPPKGWSIRIGSIYLPLPTPEELASDRIMYRPEMENLVSLRSKLLDAIADSQISGALRPAQKQVLQQMILTHP